MFSQIYKDAKKKRVQTDVTWVFYWAWCDRDYKGNKMVYNEHIPLIPLFFFVADIFFARLWLSSPTIIS